jgi:hypothetical protein
VAPDDPPDWALHSVGRIAAGNELELRSDRDQIAAEHDDGWYGTGDLAMDGVVSGSWAGPQTGSAVRA